MLGAIVNAAVAWGCLLLPLRSEATSMGLPEVDWQAIEPLGYSRKPPASRDAWNYDWRGFGVRGHEAWYKVSLTRSPPQNPGVAVSPVTTATCGWPFACAQGTRWMRREVAEAWTNGLPLMYAYDGARAQALTLDRRPHDGILPHQPIWLGVILNTIFYAAILWLLFAAPGTARRWWRTKHGLCARCGYDLHGSNAFACPECGTNVARALEAAPSRLRC